MVASVCMYVCVCVFVCPLANYTVFQKNVHPKVKWLHLTGEVDICVSCPCVIFLGFNIPKVIKIG